MLLITMLAAEANGQQVLPRFSLLQKIGITIAIGGALTVGGVWLAIEKISIGGKYIGKTIKNAASKSFYFMSSPFKQKKLPNELPQLIQSKEQISTFTAQIQKQIAQDKQNVYIVVRQRKSKDSLVVSFGLEETVNTVLIVCRKKWKMAENQSLQIFNNGVLILPAIKLKQLKKNGIGVVELDISFMETFG